jgi:hypothetical protein
VLKVDSPFKSLGCGVSTPYYSCEKHATICVFKPPVSLGFTRPPVIFSVDMAMLSCTSCKALLQPTLFSVNIFYLNLSSMEYIYIVHME